MRVVIQRVKKARVEVRGKVVGEIGQGLLILVGFCEEDKNLVGGKIWNKVIKKILNLRIFPDEEKKMNLSLLDVRGELLVVSQFTLYADCKKGNRPSFASAAPLEIALSLYNRFVEDLRRFCFGKVETGIFGEEMLVSFSNWGPVTILLDSNQL